MSKQQNETAPQGAVPLDCRVRRLARGVARGIGSVIFVAECAVNVFVLVPVVLIVSGLRAAYDYAKDDLQDSLRVSVSCARRRADRVSAWFDA